MTAIEKSKDINIIKVEELIDSIQTFELKLRSINKKKSVALRVEETFSHDEDSNEEFAFIAKRFRKFFKKNPKNPKKKNFPPKRFNENSRNKEKSRSGPQCYECKGYGHLAAECAKKSNNKTKNKAMAATWDEDSEESDYESLCSDDESSQGVNESLAFYSFLDLWFIL